MLVHSRLSSLLHAGELDLFIKSVNVKCRSFEAKLKRKKNKKICSLQKSGKLNASTVQEVSTDVSVIQKFQPRIINCTNVEFEADELNLLEKGLKFGLPPLSNADTLANVVADLEIKIGPGVNTQKKCAALVRNIPSLG